MSACDLQRTFTSGWVMAATAQDVVVNAPIFVVRNRPFTGHCNVDYPRHPISAVHIAVGLL